MPLLTNEAYYQCFQLVRRKVIRLAVDAVFWDKKISLSQIISESRRSRQRKISKCWSRFIFRPVPLFIDIDKCALLLCLPYLGLKVFIFIFTTDWRTRLAE